MATVGIEAEASVAAGAASAEETVEDLEAATKWEEGGSLSLFRNHQGAQSASESTARALFHKPLSIHKVSCCYIM